MESEIFYKDEAIAKLTESNHYLSKEIYEKDKCFKEVVAEYESKMSDINRMNNSISEHSSKF